MYTDLYLSFPDEATANAVLYTATVPNWTPVLVTDTVLQSTLDQLPLTDAENDQTVQHEGKTYMADAGQWFELVASDAPVKGTAKYQNIDTIGVIYEPSGTMLQGEFGEYPEMLPIPGWHVNIRLVDNREDLVPLMAYAITPANPVRVWGGALPPAPMPEPSGPSVPPSVTMRQGRLALLGIGMLATVDEAIASIPDETARAAAEIEWQYANTIERNSAFVQQLAAGLGLSETQLDDLFIQAATI
jgi:hypothetical protein